MFSCAAQLHRTPLSVAIARGHLPVMNFLVDQGANINVTNVVYLAAPVITLVYHNSNVIVVPLKVAQDVML